MLAIVSGQKLITGEESIVKIQIENDRRVQFSDLSNCDSVDDEINEAVFSTSPAGQGNAHPPYWSRSLHDAIIEISVRVYVSYDVKLDKYWYSVTAWHMDVEDGADRRHDGADLET